jgi:hypothetical protein
VQAAKEIGLKAILRSQELKAGIISGILIQNDPNGIRILTNPI